MTALARIHTHLLKNPPPIDYQRRRELDYTRLLPEAIWERLVARFGLVKTHHIGPSARLWLTERISGMHVRDDGSIRHQRSIQTDRLRQTLTPELLTALDSIAQKFLTEQGITGEPVTWSPPVDLIAGLRLPGSDLAPKDRRRIYRLLNTGANARRTARTMGVSVWAVRHLMEDHPRSIDTVITSPPRSQPVRRTRTGLFAEVAQLLSEAKLRDLYQRQGLHFSEIARSLQLDCAEKHLADLVSLLAQQYGLTYREGSISPRPLDPRAMRVSEALPIRPAGRPALALSWHGWRRAQWFSLIVRYRSYAEAGRQLGFGANWARGVVRHLEADWGVKLVNSALPNSMRAMRPTALGARFAATVNRIDVDTRMQGRLAKC